MTPVVIDNTVLSNFAHIQQPKLLQQAFEQPVSVQSVIDELKVGVQLGRIPVVDWSWLPIIDLTTVERGVSERFEQTLGRGEATCIALALSRQWIVLTDDRDARRVAREAGVTASGTVGALMNLVSQQALSTSEADAILDTMKQRGYRCSINSLSELDSG